MGKPFTRKAMDCSSTVGIVYESEVFGSIVFAHVVGYEANGSNLHRFEHRVK